MEKYSKRYISMKETNPDIAERMPNDAETALYNTLFTYKEKNEEVFAKLDKLAWTDFFNYRIDEYEQQKAKFGYNLLDDGLFGMGNCIYRFSVIDFLLQEIEKLRKTEEKDIPSFAQELNKEFERVNYGYRIIGNHVAPITDSEEKKEIERAISGVSDNVKEHLNRAIQYLSDKIKPDYRNSVKESISAVEAFCYKYTKKTVLSDSLKVLDKRSLLHPLLIDTFESLYYYSSAKNTGSRHGWAVEEDKYVPTYYEARFMFVSCTAFINYLKGKLDEDLNGNTINEEKR